MKELLLRYGKYNMWANKRFSDVLIKLSEEQLDMEINSSFPSIRKTVYHMWSAEDIWIQRLLLVEKPVWMQGAFEGSFEEALEKWAEASKELVSFIERQYDEAHLQHVVQYYNQKKESMKLPVSTILMQVLNHATYHRGQLVTMLRQAGVKKIPRTDFMVFPGK